MSFGARLRVMRTMRGMTQRELAAAIGVSRERINVIEQGLPPSAEIAQAIKMALKWPERADVAFNILEDQGSTAA